MTDEEIAVRILALDEAGNGDVNSWLRHWQKHFSSWADADHSGDCTSQPWSCVRCCHDETLERVKDYRRLFALDQ